MPRFFAEQKVDDYAYLSPTDTRHIEKSLRMEIGELFEVVVENQGYDACWEGEGKARLLEALPPREYSWRVTLFQGLPKGDKLEWIIQKAVELGVEAVAPVEMRFSIAKWKDPKVQKLTRLNRIAYEAASQSGRDIVPLVEEPQTFSQTVKRMGDFDVVLWANENERAVDLFEALEGLMPGVKKIALWVGPEGGFSPEESAVLADVAQSVTIGPMILRTETAGIATIAQIFYACRQKETSHGS